MCAHLHAGAIVYLTVAHFVPHYSQMHELAQRAFARAWHGIGLVKQKLIIPCMILGLYTY